MENAAKEIGKIVYPPTGESYSVFLLSDGQVAIGNIERDDVFASVQDLLPALASGWEYHIL